MLRALQKIVRNGSSVQVTIPRVILVQLGWLPGATIVVEANDEMTSLVIRQPTQEDFGPICAPRILHNGPAVAK